jgi:Integrase zinc binding domain
MLICRKSKIVIPPTLQRRIVEWYHEILCHPGMTRTKVTILQHFWWLSLRKDVQTICETCDVCQCTKRINIKCGHLPEKVAESNPWDILFFDMIANPWVILCVDMIGPYTFQRHGKKSVTLWCVTMIDPATS